MFSFVFMLIRGYLYVLVRWHSHVTIFPATRLFFGVREDVIVTGHCG